MNNRYPRETIKNDFDAISQEMPLGYHRDHNSHYYGLILRHFPVQRSRALDIGCGKGDLLELLRLHFKEATGVDFSHEMILRARTRFKASKNVHLLEVDFLEISIIRKYDLIVSVAALHHMPLKEVVLKCKKILNKDGILVVLDLYRPSSLLDYSLAAISVPLNLIGRVLLNRYTPQSKGERAAWEEHGRHESYYCMKDIRDSLREIIPGAMLKRLLYWRYLLVWRNASEKNN